LRRHSKTKRGAIGSPFCISPWLKITGRKNYKTIYQTQLADLPTIIVALDGCCDGAKLGGGGVGLSNAGDDADRAMKRDLSFVAPQGALSSRQG
jgi:hypothetical protein